MKLYNTLTRSEQPLPTPAQQKTLTLYTCGPTVYDETHIGHMRKYTMDDVLKRSLVYLGYSVQHVMNITDVGHLTGDDDSGDDKLEKGAKKHGKSIHDVIEKYTGKFWETIDALGIQHPDNVMTATEHIAEMIALIKQLEIKGYTYETPQAIYFDVTKFPAYGSLSGQKLEEKKQAARDDVFIDDQKKHPADFALWFKCVGRFASHTMHWASPWGDGFPGWHIECSAMSMAALGETIDIHTGGTDHIPVHHENEIAQSEAATGKQFVKWWVHHAFLKVNGEKMSKSKENFYTLQDLKEHTIDPIAVRYLFLQTHYRKELNFSWEAVEAAQNALQKIRKHITVIKQEKRGNVENSQAAESLMEAFNTAICDDLNTSQALAVLWETIEADISTEQKLKLILSFDTILGLQLSQIKVWRDIIPEHIHSLAQQRLEAKKQKDFQKADDLRLQIEKKGYQIKDTKEGYNVIKK